MIIAINAKSLVPPYEQLREQMATMVTTEVLQVGDRLPTIRQLARDLDLAPGTVNRAYRELERDGYLVSRGHKGTFVAKPPTALPANAASRELMEAARQFALRTRQLGVSGVVATQALEDALRELNN